MEYFPLGSLAAPARPLSAPEVLTALEHAARAAHALHEAGIAHGDIKPANVLLSRGPDGIGGQALRPRAWPGSSRPGTTLTGMGRASSVEFLDPAAAGRGPAVPAHRDLGAGRHRAPRAGRHRPLRRAARRAAAAGDPQGAVRAARRCTPACPRPMPSCVRRCLAEDGARPATAGEVADRLAELAGRPRT